MAEKLPAILKLPISRVHRESIRVGHGRSEHSILPFLIISNTTLCHIFVSFYNLKQDIIFIKFMFSRTGIRNKMVTILFILAI